MALKRRFAEKTDALIEPALPAPGDTPTRTPTTAPGQMLAFRSELNSASERIEQLEGELQQYRDSIPAFRLDPKQVHPSSWANRHSKSFASSDFQALKEDIRLAGGNVQPIKVRRLPQTPDSYEVVFGLRRHRACLELGISVLAVVVDMDDVSLFAEMDRENRQRADLSPYELGLQYKAALDRKLWPSQRQMAQALNVSNGLISQALVLAALPDKVVEAFETPLDIQYRWGRALADKLQADPDGVLNRARMIAATRGGRTSADVFKELMGLANPVHSANEQEVRLGDKVVGVIKCGPTGASIRLKPDGRIHDQALLQALVVEYLERRGSDNKSA